MKPEAVYIETELKDFRFFGEEAEALGKRLDAAREALAGAKSDWAKNQWQLVLDRLLTQWRMLPALHDGEARVTIIPKWTVEYDFFERHDGIGQGFTDKVFDSVFRSPDLNDSWERAREARLRKCSCC